MEPGPYLFGDKDFVAGVTSASITSLAIAYSRVVLPYLEIALLRAIDHPPTNGRRSEKDLTPLADILDCVNPDFGTFYLTFSISVKCYILISFMDVLFGMALT